MLSQQQAATLFQGLIEEAKGLRKKSLDSSRVVWEGWERWRTVVEDSIAQVSGEGSRNLTKFQSIKYVPLYSGITNLLAYVIGLDIAIEQLEGMLLSINLWWQSSQPVVPNVFISYGGSAKKTLLPQLKDLLLAVGVTPIIVEEQPDLGLSENDKVRGYVGISNLGIALITGEDFSRSGELLPRGNVDHEIGLMQEATNIGGRIIYLKEKGITLPSNLRQFAWVEFDKKNFSKSFVQLIRDLRPLLG